MVVLQIGIKKNGIGLEGGLMGEFFFFFINRIEYSNLCDYIFGKICKSDYLYMG